MTQAWKTVVAGLIFIVVAGCVTAPDSDTESLDYRLAWPCDRLVVSWSVSTGQAQDIVGERLIAADEDGVSRLQLSVMHCEPERPRRNTSPLTYAHVKVPLKSESVPVVITSVPADGWSAMTHLIAAGDTAALFSAMGYEVLDADVSVTSDSESEIEAKVVFGGGTIVVHGRMSSDSGSYEANKALLTLGDDHLAAFFGEETAERTSEMDVVVQIDGDTPLSSLGLSDTAATAVLSRGLRSDRIFWRLPVGQE